MNRPLLAALALFWAGPVFAQDSKPSPEALEFFEKKVRPVLAEHCYSCHSAAAKKLKADLHLDSRAGMLAGGDNGPALVPEQPDKSRLIQAIRHNNVDLKMPERYKLPDPIIADLTAWVKMGAPWPEEKIATRNDWKEFDLQKRKREHWSWQPIRVPEVPAVADATWPRHAIDRFLLAKMEARGLKPAAAADPHTLLRRLYLDLIGLPPTRAEVETFLEEYQSPRSTPQATLEKVVDRLLAAPQFGERWGRHWLDLVRYAESRGHEFDYTIPNAYQYRDYVIRALNADVPYHQFVQEHLAGDLLPTPRLHPTEGYNESILGTAFWFLGEEIHSPVDIRQDQADRFDNRIDVMSKTFLGLTVACARCHDHKFDAIATRDYYALFGILESSNYHLARFDTLTQHRKIAAQLWQLRERRRGSLQEAVGLAVLPTVQQLDSYLRAAAQLEDRSARLHPELVQRWKNALKQAEKNEASPLYAFARAVASRDRPVQEVLQPILKRWQAGALASLKGSEIIVDYRTTPVQDWLPDDVAFGPGPVRPGDIIAGTTTERPIARVVETGAAEFDSAWDGLKLAAGTQNESGALGSAMRSGRTLRTPTFLLKPGKVFALVKGSGMIYAGVAQHIMLAGPLHDGLVQHFNTGEQFQWVAVNLASYQGQRTNLEFTPKQGSRFALAVVVQGADMPSPYVPAPLSALAGALAAAHSLDDLAKNYQQIFRKTSDALTLDRLREPANAADLASLANWLVQNSELFILPASDEGKFVVARTAPLLQEQQKLLDQIRPDSRLAPAMQDSNGTDEYVFIRGNPRAAGEPVPRRFLAALAGTEPLPIKTGSGRLELARQMTDPALTPFITRVYVNRVWHHLFGRGLVGAVDNFGVLGESPTHPELLDSLADQFARECWSLKKLIRTLVLTRAYQMSSFAEEKADALDPQNLLLHRMRLRRLEGEALRDTILKVSGRLNPAMYGPPIPVYLTPFQDGRGKPKSSGPLDGDGRRSVYLSVRRNFLSSFLLAFDTPSPFSTVGRRTISNVPAQALILMNDPFVHQQAEVWAKKIVAEKGSAEDHLRGMYLDAYSRPPTEAEMSACLEYLAEQRRNNPMVSEARGWADLAHVLINTKEFFFVN